MSARQELESRGHEVTEVKGEGFYVRDPRGFVQGPWDQSQLDGWSHAVESDPVLEPVKVAKPPAKAKPKS